MSEQGAERDLGRRGGGDAVAQGEQQFAGERGVPFAILEAGGFVRGGRCQGVGPGDLHLVDERLVHVSRGKAARDGPPREAAVEDQHPVARRAGQECLADALEGEGCEGGRVGYGLGKPEVQLTPLGADHPVPRVVDEEDVLGLSCGFQQRQSEIPRGGRVEHDTGGLC